MVPCTASGLKNTTEADLYQFPKENRTEWHDIQPYYADKSIHQLYNEGIYFFKDFEAKLKMVTLCIEIE